MLKIKEIDAKETLPLRQQVLWPEKTLNELALPEDPDGIHYGLYYGNDLVSVISLFTQDKAVQFRKFATLESEQGKGFGTSLLNHAMNEMIAKGMKIIWCNARSNKTNFYQKFELRVEGQPFMKSGIEYVKMVRHVSHRSF